KQDIANLKRLAKGLARNLDPGAERLLSLTQGYLAELRGNSEAALEFYQGLISENTDEVLLEDVLRRIAFNCIGNRDMESAVAALQCLAQLSPAYAPQYADALRLTGDGQAAAEIYSDYLQKMPDDLGALLKLGKLYQELHVDEAAQMAFNYVLERDPDNGAAKAMLER
ncbi:MAG: tetratricopeptide repeat protein, partial [Desulfatiglandaceae bacterium]